MRGVCASRRFRTGEEVAEVFSPRSDSTSVGLCRGDCYGVRVHPLPLLVRREKSCI